MRKWVVKLLDNSYHIIGLSVKPNGPDYAEVLPLPEGMENEDSRWLQIENIDDGFGSLVPTVTINNVLKTQVQQQDLDNELAIENARQVDIDARNAAANKANSKRVRPLNNLQQIKDEIQNIYEILDYIMTKL